MVNNYKAVKHDDKYFRTYKAVLYKRVKVLWWYWWMDWEVCKGKEWWVDDAIAYWKETHNIPDELVIDKTEI